MPLSPQELFCGSIGVFCLILTVSFKKHKDAEEDKLFIE
jgi:hypothetical protein